MHTHEYNLIKEIRYLFWHRFTAGEIARKLQLDRSYVSKTIANKKWLAKRERYYLFLINYAYRHEMTIEQIALKTGFNPEFLRKIKRKLGIKTRRFCSHKNLEIQSKMISMYQEGFSCLEVAQKFGYKTSKTVEDILKKHKIKVRKPRERNDLDYCFFKKIDSHDKAYILGLLYTDGYIYKDYEGFCIQLTESDGYLLQNIASKIGKSVTVIDINCDTKRKTIRNALDMVRLGVYSKELAEQVKNLGVVKRKTYDMTIPIEKIPKKYIYSLLRGIIDGDGTIGIAKTGNIWCKIATKSKNFADSICMLTKKYCFDPYEFENGYGKMYSVILKGGNQQTISFLREIYKNKNDLFLTRKFDKIKQLIQGK